MIRLSPYLGAIWSFEATIAGRPRTFLFDTAGGISVITPEIAAEIGCGPWGQLSGFRMRGDRVDLRRCEHVRFGSAEAAFALETIGVWDIAKLLPKDAPLVAGSIALDGFAGRIVTIDLSRRQLIVETRASLKRRVAVARQVRLRLGREVAGLGITPFVAIDSSRGPLWMELDTGSDAAVAVDDQAAELLGLRVGDGSAQSLHAKLVGGVALETDRARAMPLAIDGNIGSLILTGWIVTLDLKRSLAWIAPAKP